MLSLNKKLYRVYREAGLEHSTEEAQTLRTRWAAAAETGPAANQEWALDFVHDAVAGSRAVSGWTNQQVCILDRKP